MNLSTKDLVTFTAEILNGKLHFLCSGECSTLLTMRCMKIQAEFLERVNSLKRYRGPLTGVYLRTFV